MNNQESFEATQRVNLDPGERPATPARRPRPTPSARAAKKKRQQRIILISLIAVALILLIAIVSVVISLVNRATEDDGLIHKGVNAAGVDLSGMTPEQAKQALHAYTDPTYTQLNMVVSVLDTTVTLSPADTGAKLDVDAVVEEAYNYGRTGSKLDQELAQLQAQNSGYTISILPYLNLDTEYIQSVVDNLGVQYSTTLKESTYSLEGTRPSMTQEYYDTVQVYQTLTIQMGTPEYGLNTDALLEQILDAYEINLFEVTAQCTITTPAALDFDQIMIDAGCVDPINAEFNVDTYEVTPEVYGYGFTMEQLRDAVEKATYGETVVLELCFLEPDILSDFYSEDMFQDTLAVFSTELSSNKNWNTNMQLVCDLLNGTIIKAGEEFSFNSIVGEPTSKRGFQYAPVYLGKSYQNLIGGGLCQVASTLYCSALSADLEILERHSHSYATEFIQAGFDAEIYYGSLDLRFRNNTENAIRIDAEIAGGTLKIVIIGTDTKSYTVDLSYSIDQTYEPGTVTNTMVQNNAGGYQAGDVLAEGITGYSISTYITRTDKTDPMLYETALIGESYYAKRDKVVVDIYEEPTEPPTEPSTAPTEPSTAPTEPSTAPTEPSTAPTEPSTAPTEPSTAPTEPSTAPTEPSTAPTEPSTAPTETSTAPTEPSTAPTEPSTAPTEPSTAPAESVPTEPSTTAPPETTAPTAPNNSPEGTTAPTGGQAE